MTVGSDNPFPSILVVEQGSTPTTPASGNQRLFVDSADGLLYLVDDTGAVTAVGGAGGLSDPMTTRGDMIVRNASNVTDRLAKGAAGTYLSSDGTDLAFRAIPKRTVNFVIDGGGSAITTGVKGDVEIPFAWTDISSVRLLADQSGSIVVNIWKDTYANFPPVVGDKITASAPPTISTATKAEDTTLTGWTKTGSAGDILRFNVDSITTVTRVTLSLVLVPA